MDQAIINIVATPTASNDFFMLSPQIFVSTSESGRILHPSYGRVYGGIVVLGVTSHYASLTCNGVLSEMAFHEKVGRSQVDSFFFSLDKVFLSSRVATVAIRPSAKLSVQRI
jgi:hypothetical protein